MIVLTIWSCSQSDRSPSRINLHEGWQFSQQGTSEWRSADVPGVIHTDLLKHGLIPHPWKGTNELDVQWVEEENWDYKMEFSLDDGQLNKNNINLVFEGLDTYAEVLLNGSSILSANNMFRSWDIPIKSLLNEGSNSLEVRFSSPIAYHKSTIDSMAYELPAGSETGDYKVSPFTRKAPYHFGWDWGPRLVTSGIWRPVYLELWDRAKIEDVQIIQNILTDEMAQLQANVILISQHEEKVVIDVFDESVEVELKSGKNTVSIPFTIEDPKRWWPNGWGESNMYKIPVSLSQNDHLIDNDTVRIGLRTVELIQENDSIGESFYFKINGEPIFAKGANYIPQSHFLPSVTESQYRSLISSAKDAHMNMLRVWGGGIYENDLFYELCDENGILVWQDFMFAGSMYPGDSAFLENVKQEVIENVVRLRNHPSIIHWNGNNEIDVAWKNWGWQDQYGYSKEDSASIWQDYLTLFHDLIPDLLNDLDDRPYTITSPLSNWGTPENFNYGSMHYWGVWHGQDDFEAYDNNVGRFMSEYGFQSFPNMETISYFSDSADWDLESTVMIHHQKSYVGNGMILKNIRKYFSEPKDFSDFVVKSQKTQAKAMQIAIDAHRLNKGHCWGSLYWQLNDCWPGPSWSSIDVFGREKEFHVNLKTLFAPIAIIPNNTNGLRSIWVINDTLEEFTGKLTLNSYQSRLQPIYIDLPVEVEANGLVEVKLPQLKISDSVSYVLKDVQGQVISQRGEKIR